MKFVFASDSFKGSLSSGEIGKLLEDEASRVFPSAELVTLPMADGGEGTLDAIRSVRSGEDVALHAQDGLGRSRKTKFFISDGEAFIESAAICGLAKVDPNELDPFVATSSGVGACIGHALLRGCRRITVGLGGTCTNDGGMGCLRALGIRFFDRNGRELAGCGADLSRVASIDESTLLAQARDAEITVMCDVTNPLLGQNGATRTFAPQKGADAAAVGQLESGMRNFADVIARTHPRVNFDTPGYGAAGGLGMALSVFLGAKMRSGIETMLDWLRFDEALEGADLVVTGEGRLDEQSLHGKAISGVARRAQREGVPVAAICGRVRLDREQIEKLGLEAAIESGAGQDDEHALSHAEENYRRAARQLFENRKSMFDRKCAEIVSDYDIHIR